jgi:hypothetical protein
MVVNSRLLRHLRKYHTVYIQGRSPHTARARGTSDCQREGHIVVRFWAFNARSKRKSGLCQLHRCIRQVGVEAKSRRRSKAAWVAIGWRSHRSPDLIFLRGRLAQCWSGLSLSTILQLVSFFSWSIRKVRPAGGGMSVESDKPGDRGTPTSPSSNGQA